MNEKSDIHACAIAVLEMRINLISLAAYFQDHEKKSLLRDEEISLRRSILALKRATRIDSEFQEPTP